MNRLLLCSGPTSREGWRRLDANAKFSPDFLASIPPLPTDVAAVKWDVVELIHGITSFYPWDAEQVLMELRAVMADGGTLILEQPDASKCDPATYPEWLFGNPQFKNPMHMNRWAYTPDRLTRLVNKCGFPIVRIFEAQHHNPQRDFRLEAIA